MTRLKNGKKLCLYLETQTSQEILKNNFGHFGLVYANNL